MPESVTKEMIYHAALAVQGDIADIESKLDEHRAFQVETSGHRPSLIMEPSSYEGSLEDLRQRIEHIERRLGITEERA